MSQELCEQIDRIVRVESAETNELAIENRTEQIRRTMSFITSRVPSKMTLHRQTIVRTDAENISRWNWTGRFWHWTAAVNFTDRARGELLMRRTEKLFAWLREQNRLRQIRIGRRDFFEVKAEFDESSVRITSLYVQGDYAEMRRLLVKERELLEELTELATAGASAYELAAIA